MMGLIKTIIKIKLVILVVIGLLVLLSMAKKRCSFFRHLNAED